MLGHVCFQCGSHSTCPPPATLSTTQAIGAEPVLVQQCQQIVHDYVPEMLKIINTMPPQAVCATVGLCNGGEASYAGGRVSTATARRLLARYGPARGVGADPALGDDEMCQMCQFVVQYAKVRRG